MREQREREKERVEETRKRMKLEETTQNKQHKVTQAPKDWGGEWDERCTCGWVGYGTARTPAARDHHFRIVQEQGGKLVKQMIYLASPHSHTSSGVRLSRYVAALQCTSWLIEQGFWVFSPIVHSHNLPCNVGDKISYEYWKEFDVETITRMDEVWVLIMPGTKESKGVREEVKVARLQGKRVMGIWWNGYDKNFEVEPLAENYFVVSRTLEC